MATMTSQQLRDYEARMYGRIHKAEVRADATNDESDLQDVIISESRKRGWWVDYSRMDLPTTRPKGAPDIYIFADRKRLFIVEAKSKTGKLRPEQLGVKLALEKLGHTVNVISSFSQFIELIDNSGNP